MLMLYRAVWMIAACVFLTAMTGQRGEEFWGPVAGVLFPLSVALLFYFLVS
jgi:uncharacterized membrane protein YhdT